MDGRSRTHEGIAAGWIAYGIRDALVFAAGFVLASVLIAPFS